MQYPTHRLILSTLLLLTVFTTLACETDVPAVDNEPPEIQLVMNGGGIGSQSMSNPPTEIWSAPTGGGQLFDMTSGAEYTFTLTVTDDGGVARAAILMPADFEVRNLSPGVRVVPTGIRQSLTITGDRSSPRKALVVSGQFSPPDTDSRNVDFSVEADDFGGSDGRTNQRFMLVRAGLNSGLP